LSGITVVRDNLHQVIIRDARPSEYAAVGELRVAAYRAAGLLPDGSGYAETLLSFGFDGDCVVLVAVDGAAVDAAADGRAAVDAADDGAAGEILGTVTLEPFGPASELARDETEADIRAFAVVPQAQGLGVGRKLLSAVIECAQRRGVCRLRLCTRPIMEAAQHLYATTGFSRTPDLDWEPIPGVVLRAYERVLLAVLVRATAS
jgi:ribosomal protein S18 acetylase RimI-like enzyme